MSLVPRAQVFMLFSNTNVQIGNKKIYIDNNNYAEPYNIKLKKPIMCVNDLSISKVKFLRVLVDPNLNFKLHIKSISSKIYNSLFHLRAAKNILSQKALTTF
jgi:hypothetical protein